MTEKSGTDPGKPTVDDATGTRTPIPANESAEDDAPENDLAASTPITGTAPQTGGTEDA